MKKIFIILAVCAAAGCSNTIKNENGSENLIQLKMDPIGCKNLYKITAEASVYSQDDAVRHLQNRIASQANPGNAYLIVASRARPNEGAVFGPSQTYEYAAEVYDCPNTVAW